jgi:hypothetical protein
VNLQEFRRVLQITLLLPLLLLLLLALALAWQIQRTLGEQQRIDHNDQIAAELGQIAAAHRSASTLADPRRANRE